MDKTIDELLDELRLDAPAEYQEPLARAFDIVGFLTEVAAVEGRAFAKGHPLNVELKGIEESFPTEYRPQYRALMAKAASLWQRLLTRPRGSRANAL
jgi:hypothetical protein